MISVGLSRFLLQDPHKGVFKRTQPPKVQNVGLLASEGRESVPSTSGEGLKVCTESRGSGMIFRASGGLGRLGAKASFWGISSAEQPLSLRNAPRTLWAFSLPTHSKVNTGMAIGSVKGPKPHINPETPPIATAPQRGRAAPFAAALAQQRPAGAPRPCAVSVVFGDGGQPDTPSVSG